MNTDPSAEKKLQAVIKGARAILESLTGLRAWVDIIEEHSLSKYLRERILQKARPL